ncbi:MAG TPA: helix-hairpin-helix domain-containing protein [Pyrinomonadaceae bacterium]|nr:helix-hairpin-helix domain-containing protein [Pyrinomonadaceae bacterium]
MDLGLYNSEMDNEALAGRFNRLANMMEIRGDDHFRIRSYRNAAEIIETWPTPLKTIAAEEGVKGLQTIPGVGKAISGKIIELLEKGTFDAWEKLKAETPETVLDLLKVSGVGIKTASTLYQQFKISSLDDLKQFVAGGGLEMVDGIGDKSAERIASSVRRL